MAKTKPAPELTAGPIASTGDGRDITRPWVQELEQPRDPRLLQAVDWGVYDRILLDDQVKSTFQQRRAAVTSREWEVVPGDKTPAAQAAADALTDDLKRIGFDRLTDKMLFSVFHGYAVAELGWAYIDGRWAWSKIWVRHARRFRYDKDGALRLITRGRPQGETLPDNKFWVLTSGASDDDEPYGRGLAEWLYWPTFFKRGGIRSWMIFLDKFGAPTALGKYRPGTPPSEVNKLLGALQAIATDSGIAVPEGMAIELLEAARSGTSSYGEMAGYMDSAIAKVVLSQTMTTDDGSSRSQAQVHGGVKMEVVKSDADLFCDGFNQGPVAWWHAFNFGDGVAQPRVIRKVEEEVDLKVTAETDKVLDEMGWERTDESFKETYGDGYQRKAAPAAAPANPAAAPGDQRAPGTRPGAPAQPDAGQQAAFAATDPRPLYVQRKVVNAGEILDWAEKQGIAGLLPPDDLHVTIAYSRRPIDWMKVGQASWTSPAAPGGKLLIPAGGPRLVERFTADGPMVLLFASNDLAWRNREIRDAGASWDHDGYYPHITLSYAPGDVDLASITPWRGLIELGPEIFEPIDENWKDRYAIPSFAEAVTLPPLRDDIDAIAQAAADAGWREVLSPIVDPALAAIADAATPDQLDELLVKALASMDASSLQATLERAGFTVEMAARLGTDDTAAAADA